MLSTLPAMARRPWSRSISVALFASAGAAAAQLGLGYGLGIVAWTLPDGATAASSPVPDTSVLTGGAWSAGLAWTTWVAATSVVVGAIAGTRRANEVHSGRIVRLVWRVVIGLAATLGALVAVPLAAIPARHAEIADTYAPHLLAAIYAVAGAGLGLLVSLVAVAARAVAANVIASAVWLWVLAIVAAADGLITNDGRGYTHLAVWEFTHGGPFLRSLYVPGALLTLGAALLVGGLAALPSAGRGAGRLGVAVSGAAGPLMVAVSYVLADPRPPAAPDIQMSALYTSPYLVLAGLAGSVLVALVGTVPARRRPAAAGLSGDDAAPARRPAQRAGADAHSAMPMAPAVGRSGGPASPTAVSATARVPASSRLTPGEAG